MLSFSVDITESAQTYLSGLLEKQEDNADVRMFVLNPGTPSAETCLSFCREGDDQEDDEILELDAFKVFFEKRSAPYLEDARVDYAEDKMGGQLTIRAPNSRVPKVSDDSPIEDKVNYVLWNEVNPGLASHGGEVSLMEIAEGPVAVLKFGGGCQGCSMLDVTLKEGVEKTLLEKLPELTAVRDVTDHTDTSNAYYQ